MKVTRRNTFETNSSSTHSFSFTGVKKNFETPSSEIYFGEFGWGEEELDSVDEILSYLFTLIQYVDESVHVPHPLVDYNDPLRDKIIKEFDLWRYDKFLNSKYYIWIKEVIFETCEKEIVACQMTSDYYPMGYIDHQSLSPCIFEEEFSLTGDEFKSRIKDIIFGNTVITIDNDNH